MLSLFLILSVVAFVCGKLTNLDDIAHRTIRLQAHEIDTRKADSFVDDTDFQRYSSRFDSTQKFQFLVHLKAPVHQSKLNIEKHFNVEFLDYIPHNTYVLMMNRQLAEQIDQDENVLFVAASLPEHRISIELLPRSSVADEEPPTALTIDLISNADRDNFIEKMSTSFGDSEAIELIRKSNSAEHRILIELKKDVQWNQINNVANHFAQQPETRWIEASHPNQSLNKFASAVMWTGDATTPTSPLNGPYDGTGVIVGILDNGIDASSCYFSGKINGQNSFGGDGKDSSKGHGTAMAGTCCGKGGTEPGVASGAKLHITDLSSDETIPSDAPIKLALEGAAAAQASVVVIAFGARAKWYNSVAADIDAFAAANPAITVVVAAGNDGYSGTPGIVTTAYSKNAIVVGAIQNALEGFIAANQGADANLLQWARDYRGVIGADMVTSFSSRGPTLDGRLKPDIVAPGEFVVTAAPGACNQRSTSGTSVSAAAVAGAAAIVHQYLGATRAGQPIRSATVKALLLHSGRRVASAGSSASASDVDRAQDAGAWPSNVYGYGRVALDDVIPRPGAAKQAAPIIVEEQLTAGASYATCYTVPKGGSLRATLVWTDAAGSPSAGNALVNDLNLAVWNDANGFEWRGNHKIEFDNQNSVEAVWINGADAGVYGVNVNAFTLSGAMQQFSLIISGDVTPAQCNKCPLNCSGSSTCAAGKCTCTGGAGGDCSIKVCPGQCSKNGVCDTGTGVCTCGRGWQGAGCETPKTPDTTINLLVNTKTYDTGISAGMFFGLLVLACIIGFGCALFCGGFIGARMMQVRRDRQMGR